MSWSVRYRGELLAWFAAKEHADAWRLEHAPRPQWMGDDALVLSEERPGVEALERARTAVISLRGALAQEQHKVCDLERQMRELEELIRDYRDTERKLYAELRHA